MLQNLGKIKVTFGTFCDFSVRLQVIYETFKAKVYMVGSSIICQINLRRAEFPAISKKCYFGSSDQLKRKLVVT